MGKYFELMLLNQLGNVDDVASGLDQMKYPRWSCGRAHCACEEAEGCCDLI